MFNSTCPYLCHRLEEEGNQGKKGEKSSRLMFDSNRSAVGGHIAPMKHVHDPASEKAELERFDRKVYIACKEMVAATVGELGRLGVPFFGMQKEGKIEDEELRRLRAKMVGLLEDLCRD